MSLFGQNDENLKHLKKRLGARVVARGDELRLMGDEEAVREAESTFRTLLRRIRHGERVSLTELEHTELDTLEAGEPDAPAADGARLPARTRPKTAGQRRYVARIQENPITFGIGPAGTGKTYLAVAMAAAALQERTVKRIILTRPAVEAGEKLGFLPGDLQAKIDPYLRPLYDALYDMMPAERIDMLLEQGTIEVAPLAFMRGRAQPVATPVLTPFGWRAIGTLQPGDAVIGSDGRPTQVLGVYPQGRKAVYRVTMSDGASTHACGEHLWAVRTPSDERRNRTAEILETRQMIGRLRPAHQYWYELPLLTSPVAFPEREVPLDPYALGLLLGDGCLTTSTTPAFASADAELVEALGDGLAPLGVRVAAKSGVDYTRLHVHGGRGGVMLADPVTEALRRLDLAGTRPETTFVPEVYLHNAVDVRTALLQGLLDSDGGTVEQEKRPCRIRFATSSKRLADDVVFLVRSLGGVAYHPVRPAEGRAPGGANGQPGWHCNDAHILDIQLPTSMVPFRLRRKSEVLARSGRGRPKRFIHAIEPAGEEECVCIRVAAPDHLYVTEDLILTHNTLNDAFIILDEAQNTTSEQMKMFLTRMGFNSKVVVTGDVTQTDLPGSVKSGLRVAEDILGDIEGIGFIYFTKADVVRHPLVASIINAYESHG